MDPNAAGVTFPPYEFHVERGKIREFADALGDPNPIYRDPDYAAKTEIGSIVAVMPSSRRWNIAAQRSGNSRFNT